MSKKNKKKDDKEKTVKSINNNIRSSVRKLNPILKMERLSNIFFAVKFAD